MAGDDQIPAFPANGYAGLSRRELFAAVAMHALIARARTLQFDNTVDAEDREDAERLAMTAYLVADAMIDEADEA